MGIATFKVSFEGLPVAKSRGSEVIVVDSVLRRRLKLHHSGVLRQ